MNFTLDQVLTLMRNLGVDVTCSACTGIAFTGASLVEHTCKGSLPSRIATLKTELQASRFPTPDPSTVEREQEVLMLFTVEQARLWNARIDVALAPLVGGGL